MQVNLLFFGIIADLIGETSMIYETDDQNNIADLKRELSQSFPQLQSYQTYAIAVNEEYASDDNPLKHKDTIAFIPPVSGG